MEKPRRLGARGVAVAVALAVIGAALFAGCGSSSSSGGGSGTASTSGAGSDLEVVKQEVSALYKGESTAPVGGPVTATPGKKVWVISIGQSIEVAQLVSQTTEALGKKLGWDITVFDGKFETSRQLTGIQQAVAAGADGIILAYVDCAPVKAGVEEAVNAGIPVVGIESHDCEPSLVENIKFQGGKDFEEYGEGRGESVAKWLIAATEGSAKVIMTEETDLITTVKEVEAATREFERCSGCEVLETIKFTGASFNTLQQKIEQSLNRNPEANAFYSNYDAVMTVGGGAAALRASGRLPEMSVAGGEGSPGGMELIRNEEGLDACAPASGPWEGYEAVTLMARLFAGQNTDKANSGMGSQLCDQEHGMPPNKGEPAEFPVDFVAAYEKILGLK